MGPASSAPGSPASASPVRRSRSSRSRRAAGAICAGELAALIATWLAPISLELARSSPPQIAPAAHLDLAGLDTGDTEEPEAREPEAEEPGPAARSVGARVAWAVAHSAEAFALFDKDGSGALDVAEVYNALDLLGMLPHEKTSWEELVSR